MSDENQNKRKVKKLRLTKDYLISVSNYQNYLTPEGKLIPEVQILINLLKELGIPRIQQDDEIQEFAYRFFRMYGNTQIMENLFLHNQFVHFYHTEYLEAFEENDTLESKFDYCKQQGEKIEINFKLLSQLKGLQLQDDEGFNNEKFEQLITQNQKVTWASVQNKKARGFKIFSLFVLDTTCTQDLIQSKDYWANFYSKRVLLELKKVM
jgi:hypothetical protein